MMSNTGGFEGKSVALNEFNDNLINPERGNPLRVTDVHNNEYGKTG